MDISNSYDSYFSSEESQNEAACYSAAIKDGFTVELADTCEAGQLGCSECPWRDE